MTEHLVEPCLDHIVEVPVTANGAKVFQSHVVHHAKSS